MFLGLHATEHGGMCFSRELTLFGLASIKEIAEYDPKLGSWMRIEAKVPLFLKFSTILKSFFVIQFFV